MLRRAQTDTDYCWCPWAGSNCRPLPYQGSALPLSHMGAFYASTTRTGAGEGNRTLVVSLEGFCSTIELHPHGPLTIPYRSLRLCLGGGGWIRTNVGVSQQIYSLPPLATRAPLRRELTIMEEHPICVKHIEKIIFTFSKMTRLTRRNQYVFAGIIRDSRPNDQRMPYRPATGCQHPRQILLLVRTVIRA